jgi:ankyrin repeat protein
MGNIDMIAYLINNGADHDAKDMDGYSVIHLACILNQSTIVAYLLAKGLDVNYII